MKKEETTQIKLELNKKTIIQLTEEQMQEVDGGARILGESTFNTVCDECQDQR